jgi:hypothetical protein
MATLFTWRPWPYSACMRTVLIIASSLVFCFLAGCESVPAGFPGSGRTKTFELPIARVKPAFVATLTQRGMPISAIEVRGKSEVIKSKKADKSVEIEFERLTATSTRVNVSGSDNAQIMRETEKRLSGG